MDKRKSMPDNAAGNEPADMSFAGDVQEPVTGTDAGQENAGGIDGLSIEESFDRLDSILERMEDEETGLMDTFKLYEEGLKLVKSVSASIDKVEKQIEVLDAGED